MTGPLPPLPGLPSDPERYAQLAQNEIGPQDASTAANGPNPRRNNADLLNPLPPIASRFSDNPRHATAPQPRANQLAPAARAEGGPVLRDAQGNPRRPDAVMNLGEGRLHQSVAGPDRTLDDIERAIQQRQQERQVAAQRLAEQPATQETQRAGSPTTRAANTAESGAQLPLTPGTSVEDDSLYWRPYLSVRRPVTPHRDAEGNIVLHEERNYPIFPERPRSQDITPSAETQHTPEAQESEKTKWQKIKGVVSAFTRPYTWTGKSKKAYIFGAIVGGTATGLGFAGMGPVPRLAITAGTYATSFALEKISRWHLKKQLTPAERLRFEERYKNARYKLSGFSSGLAASSLMNLGLHAVAPEMMQNVAEAAREVGRASLDAAGEMGGAGARLGFRMLPRAINAAGNVAEFGANVGDRIGDAHQGLLQGIRQAGESGADFIDTIADGTPGNSVGEAIADAARDAGGSAMDQWRAIADTAGDARGVAAELIGDIVDHAPGGPESFDSQITEGAREFFRRLVEGNPESAAEALGIARETASDLGGEVGARFSDWIEQYFNSTEMVVEAGHPLEHMLDNLGVTGHAYNNPEWMVDFITRNDAVLSVGNEIGVNNFYEFALENPDASAEEFRKHFFRAVHWIYPGQTLDIPLP